jgi:UDP-3-O-[3-hydroxymyristoyl] N-acetylglucosamine deacetylase
MAAFAGLAIDNAIVELDNYEVPIMDGSAVRFTSLMHRAGVMELDAPRCFFEVLQPIEIQKDDKFVAVYPSSRFVFTCRIDYDHPLIKRQSYTFEMSETAFEKEISGARTFGFLHDVETMKRFGLARGGSLENVVVVDQDKILNEDGLRFKDEFVRHKLLDCIGDFALLGMPMLGHVVAEKSGHAFNHAFLQEFFSRKASWKTRPLKRRSR